MLGRGISLFGVVDLVRGQGRRVSVGRHATEILRAQRGLAPLAQLHPLMGVLIQRALELVEQCPCESDHGCPSCVQHTGCGEYNTVLHKDSGRIVLMHVLKHEVVFGEPSDVKVKPEEGGTHGT